MTCKIFNSSFVNPPIDNEVQSLVAFTDKKFGFKKPPTIHFDSDEHNASKTLAKTGYYDPETQEVHVYVTGRHVKDILRSIAHELVHHHQNEQGYLTNAGYSGKGYAQKNPHLRKMELQANHPMLFRDWEDSLKENHPTIYNERRNYKMSFKEWKNKELNTNLNKKWGFGMDLSKLNEGKEITHMCALHVIHESTKKEGHPISHTLDENGNITHYTVEFDDVIVEDIAVENLTILQQEEHSHKKDDEKEHDDEKKRISEEELEEQAKPDYIDLDKDGDKEESMKKAAEDAKKDKKEEPKEDKKEKPNAMNEMVERAINKAKKSYYKVINEYKKNKK